MAVILLLSGCAKHYRYVGFSEADFNDNTRVVADLALDIDHFTGVLNLMRFKPAVKQALIEEGFDDLHFGSGYRGYSITIDINRISTEKAAFSEKISPSMATLPLNNKNVLSFKVKFFYRGELLRTTEYQSVFFKKSGFFPAAGNRWPDSEHQLYQKIAKNLAKNITLDFPYKSREN